MSASATGSCEATYLPVCPAKQLEDMSFSYVYSRLLAQHLCCNPGISIQAFPLDLLLRAFVLSESAIGTNLRQVGSKLALKSSFVQLPSKCFLYRRCHLHTPFLYSSSSSSSSLQQALPALIFLLHHQDTLVSAPDSDVNCEARA